MEKKGLRDLVIGVNVYLGRFKGKGAV